MNLRYRRGRRGGGILTRSLLRVLTSHRMLFVVVRAASCNRNDGYNGSVLGGREVDKLGRGW